MKALHILIVTALAFNASLLSAAPGNPFIPAKPKPKVVKKLPPPKPVEKKKEAPPPPPPVKKELPPDYGTFVGTINGTKVYYKDADNQYTFVVPKKPEAKKAAPKKNASKKEGSEKVMPKKTEPKKEKK